MGILSRLFGGNDEPPAQPKEEPWITMAEKSEKDMLDEQMEACPNCWYGHVCAQHMDRLEEIFPSLFEG